MNAIALRKKTDDELRTLAGERRVRSRELAIGIAQGKVKNVRELRAVRRDIARIETLLRQRR